MSEISEEPRKGLSTKWPLRLIAIFAGAILLGFGLCGVDAHFYPASATDEFAGARWVALDS